MKLVRFILPLLLSLFAASTVEAGMLRVLAIEDGRTVVVAAATPTRIKLAGIEIIDGAEARLFLEYALESAWIFGEKRSDGYVIWRSPDGMFVNRELVLRGYARATSPELEPRRNFSVTYLGQLSPRSGSRSPAPSVSERRGTGSGTESPHRARRSPRGRQPRKNRSAHTP